VVKIARSLYKTCGDPARWAEADPSNSDSPFTKPSKSRIFYPKSNILNVVSDTTADIIGQLGHRLLMAMSVPNKLYSLPATELLALFKNNSVTIKQYAQSLLERTEERNTAVRAWAYLDHDLVIQQAKALDQIPHGERGPLHGIAVGVKDVMMTKGS
jgi:hypothetical protein